MTPFFSIIVVCLNPGEKLLQTLQSIQKQEFRDYEIVLKDGGSTDGSLQKLDPEQSGLHVVTKPDRGIYDAMNQAVEEQAGMIDPRREILNMAMEKQIDLLNQKIAALTRENSELKKKNEKLQKALKKQDLNFIKNL